jgi:glycosyltransferase involved in cell wall biosynthesis
MVAVKNEEKNIARCINSMLRQTYKDKETIVVNDGSTDRTLEIDDMKGWQNHSY